MEMFSPLHNKLTNFIVFFISENRAIFSKLYCWSTTLGDIVPMKKE